MATTTLHPNGLPGIPYIFIVKTPPFVCPQNPNFTEARDCILVEFKAFWEADILSSSIPLFYQDVRNNIPDVDTWAEVIVNYTSGGTWAVGREFKRRSGQVLVRIHTPIGQGLSLGYELGIIALNALKGENLKSQIWFRNGSISEEGKQDSRMVIEVSVDFVHSQLR